MTIKKLLAAVAVASSTLVAAPTLGHSRGWHGYHGGVIEATIVATMRAAMAIVAAWSITPERLKAATAGHRCTP